MSEHHDTIGAAFEDWVHSLPSDGSGESGILGDWVAVVAMVNVDAEGHPRVEYYLCMRDGSMLPHVGKGLLAEGIDLMDQQREDGSDDD
jgi:hypothetical protein